MLSRFVRLGESIFRDNLLFFSLLLSTFDREEELTATHLQVIYQKIAVCFDEL